NPNPSRRCRRDLPGHPSSGRPRRFAPVGRRARLNKRLTHATLSFHPDASDFSVSLSHADPTNCRTLPRYFVEMEARVLQARLVLSTGDQTKAPCMEQVTTTGGQRSGGWHSVRFSLSNEESRRQPCRRTGWTGVSRQAEEQMMATLMQDTFHPKRSLSFQGEAVGPALARYGLVVVVGWIGFMKFTGYEAEGIRPFVANSPLMSWVYGLMSVQGFSALLGVVEVAVALLIAARPLLPRVSAFGSALAVGMFL